jgi:predicted nucleotide-binding protein
MYYHILFRITDNLGQVRLNLSEDELIIRYVNPYLVGELITINGVTIEPKKLMAVNVRTSEGSLDDAVKRIKQENRIGPPGKKFIPEIGAFFTAEDATNDYITAPPGSKTSEKLSPTKVKGNKVFIVHGHDAELKNDAEIFVKSIELEPIVLHRQPDGGLTLIEKFERYSEVGFAIILLTPDDFGYPKSEAGKIDEEKLIEIRARQNVIFEWGFFVGKLGRKNVCCIYKEGISLPSDMHGLIYKPVKKSLEEVGFSLMKELNFAGMPIVMPQIPLNQI